MNLLVNGGYGIQNTGSPGSFEIIDPELYVRSLMQTVRTLRTALYKTLQSLDSGIIPQELQQLLASFVVSGDID